MDQSVVRYVFILHESDFACKHYTAFSFVYFVV